MALDIDKLHNCVERVNQGDVLARHAGTSTAILELLKGEAYFGPAGFYYIVVGIHEEDARRISNNFYNWLIMEQLPMKIKQQLFVKLEHGASFMFMGLGRFCGFHTLRGLRIARVFLDVPFHLQDQRYNRIREILMDNCVPGQDVFNLYDREYSAPDIEYYFDKYPPGAPYKPFSS